MPCIVKGLEGNLDPYPWPRVRVLKGKGKGLGKKEGYTLADHYIVQTYRCLV